MSNGRLCSNYYSSSGTFVCPAGVTQVFVLAHGGGGAGSGGFIDIDNFAYCGVGTTPILVPLSVTPNTSYSITIGAGGIGGDPRYSTSQNGGAGGDTTFGGLFTFKGGAQQTNETSTAGPAAAGITPFRGHVHPKATGTGNVLTSGFVNYTQIFGADFGSRKGGSGGCPGYSGTPSTGGAGSSGFGGDPPAVSGLGTGGAGAGAGAFDGGTGQNGGPGQMWIMWVE